MREALAQIRIQPLHSSILDVGGPQMALYMSKAAANKATESPVRVRVKIKRYPFMPTLLSRRERNRRSHHR